jgi:glycosyltransferase involved in cell wall biosynthesis
MKIGPSISAVLPVKNEENRILKLHLDHLSQFCAEIIIVDMGSTDRTVEICRQFTEKIYYHDGGPSGLIPIARKYGSTFVECEWEFWDDADLIYSGAFQKELIQKIQNDNKSALRVFLANYFFGKWFLNHRHAQIRFLKRGRAQFEVSDAHNMQFKIDGPIDSVNSLVYHYGHPSVEHFVQNMNKYTSQDAVLISTGQNAGLVKDSYNKLGFVEMVVRPIYRIFHFYFRQKYYKEGVHGLIFSVLMGVYFFLEAAKSYEYKWKSANNWVYGRFDEDIFK